MDKAKKTMLQELRKKMLSAEGKKFKPKEEKQKSEPNIMIRLMQLEGK